MNDPHAGGPPSPYLPTPAHHVPGMLRPGQAMPGISLEEALGERRRREPPRRYGMALGLFLLTCVSLYWVGLQDFSGRRGSALLYAACVIAVLLTHEMGHFLQSLRYGLPASLPYFIPFPSKIGTMGALIVQYDFQNNRKQLFDIGISGPLAGLVVAIPLAVWGIMTATPVPIDFRPGLGVERYGDPLLFTWLTWWLRPDLGYGRELFLNPQLKAAWFGLLLTGLNMMPVGQLDGGHVSYAVFHQRAGLVARLFIAGAIAAMVMFDRYEWILMMGLVLVIGLDHPPTIDDNVPLDWFRASLGIACLILIPLTCFTPVPFSTG